MHELRRLWGDFLCFLGIHDWFEGEHYRSGNPARRCLRCDFSQEAVAGWVRTFPGHVVACEDEE